MFQIKNFQFPKQNFHIMRDSTTNNVLKVVPLDSAPRITLCHIFEEYCLIIFEVIQDYSRCVNYYVIQFDFDQYEDPLIGSNSFNYF